MENWILTCTVPFWEVLWDSILDYTFQSYHQGLKSIWRALGTGLAPVVLDKRELPFKRSGEGGHMCTRVKAMTVTVSTQWSSHIQSQSCAVHGPTDVMEKSGLKLHWSWSIWVNDPRLFFSLAFFFNPKRLKFWGKLPSMGIWIYIVRK